MNAGGVRPHPLGARVHYGADYNPEQWPPHVWQDDVARMRDAGVTLVSVAVFAWAELQPGEGAWTFDWLDEVLDLLAAHGVGANLGTATASPPSWLSTRHPEILPVTPEGVQLSPGSRQHYCPSSPVYRRAAGELVSQLAGRYGHHPALVAWHVGNEYGNHVGSCVCEVSAAAFRRWLRDRYGTIAELNKAWATTFWSQRYGDFEEVGPPRATPTFANPSQVLDFRRFSSDELRACYLAEVEILRSVTPHIPCTTNFQPVNQLRPVDAWRVAEEVDVVAYNSYPDPEAADRHVSAAWHADLMRSLRAGQPWMLMEQSPGRVNWREHNVTVDIATVRRDSLQAVARGADAVMFFQWRASIGGAEQWHSGMIGHAPPEASPRWSAFCSLGRELDLIKEVAGATVRSDVAVMLDWDSWWALEQPARPSARLSTLGQIEAYYRPLHAANITTDFVARDGDLTPYRLVVLPSLYLMDDATVARLEAFVERGGSILVGPFSGVVDPYDHVRAGGYPGALRRVLGLRITEYSGQPDGANATLRFNGGAYATSTWREDLVVEGADVLGELSVSGWSGPAVTCHRYGAGRAWYVATCPDAAGLAAVCTAVTDMCGVVPVLPAPSGVEVVARTSATSGRWVFCLNHDVDAREVVVAEPHRDVLSGSSGRRFLLPAGDVAVLRPLGA